MAVVETIHLTKVFKGGDGAAVNDVSLKSKEGEFLVFLGPSGSGKTTLLRMIAGLEQPTSGQILIGDADVTQRTPRERRIAMVFQSYALYPHLSVYNNIAFPLKAQKVPKGQHREKVDWAASLLGIQDLLKRKPRELSGGERQRVALARALVREPMLFLLDEPLSNLDAKLRATAREDLQAFFKRVGTTTVYVTHDQVEAMAMGDRIMVMNKGMVQQVGTPKDVYDDPSNTFVATFLGSPPMNLLEQGDVIVGFRPEHFLPASLFRGGSDFIPLRFQIHLMEFLGAERILYGHLEGGRFDNTKEVVSRIPSTIPVSLTEGSVNEFGVREKSLRFFDRQTEQRTEPKVLAWQ
jgi:multiple sugar transport system ATP-binding protein